MNSWSNFYKIRACLNDGTVATYSDIFMPCSLYVGMRPDEATESIVDISLAQNKPFAIVPCCVMSRKFPNRYFDGEVVATYETFVAYLKAKKEHSIGILAFCRKKPSSS